MHICADGWRSERILKIRQSIAPEHPHRTPVPPPPPQQTQVHYFAVARFIATSASQWRKLRSVVQTIAHRSAARVQIKYKNSVLFGCCCIANIAIVHFQPDYVTLLLLQRGNSNKRWTQEIKYLFATCFTVCIVGHGEHHNFSNKSAY